MSGFIDTSVVVRYLTGDPPEMAEQAARIIDGATDARITDVVLMEAAYVLGSNYRVPRADVVDALVGLVEKRNIVTHGLDKSMVILALQLCRPSNRVSFADALLWAVARSAGPAVVYSFDRRFPREGVEIRRQLI